MEGRSGGPHFLAQGMWDSEVSEPVCTGDSHERATEQGSSNGTQEETPLHGAGWGASERCWASIFISGT